MIKSIQFAFIIFLTAALSNIPAIAATNTGSPLIAELTGMLAGEFESRKQMEEDKAKGLAKGQSHAWINRSFVRVDAPEFDGPVLVGSTLYRSKSWIFDQNEYLVWTFSTIENGKTIVATPRRFKDQQRRLPFARDAQRLSDFSENDLEAARSGAACLIYWTKTDTGFSGETRDCQAMSTVHEKMMNWDWRYQLRSDALLVEFFGTDNAGTLLDGTPKGNPYRLDRLGAALPGAARSDTINAVLRTATIYVKDWDASIRFYTEYLGYKLLAEQPITAEKSLKTIGAGPGVKARIAYLKPVNNLIKRPFAGNYLGLIGFSGPGHDEAAYQRSAEPSSAVLGETVLAHQVVGIDRIYPAMQKDKKVTIVAELGASGSGQSRSFSVIDPNGVRVEIYEFVAGKEPTANP